MRAPQITGPYTGKRAQAVDAEPVEDALLRVGEAHGQLGDADEADVDAGGRLPDAALAVGAGDHPGHDAARRELAEPVLVERVGHAHPREVERSVVVA